MDEFAVLAAEDSELMAMLKANQARRAELERARAEEEALANAARHEETARAVAALAPVTVLGVNYENVRKLVRDNGLRIVPVHYDVTKLLRAAMPSKNEEHFAQLCSALVEKLSYGNQLALRSAIDTLRVSPDTSHYFASQDASIPIVTSGRIASLKADKISDMITVYALEFGRVTEYEEK